MGAKLTRNWRRWLPILCAVGAFMIIPYWIFDTAYVNLRFAVFLFPLSLFLFEQDKLKILLNATACHRLVVVFFLVLGWFAARFC